MPRNRDYTKLRVGLAIATVVGVGGTYAGIAAANPDPVEEGFPDAAPVAAQGTSFTAPTPAPTASPTPASPSTGWPGGVSATTPGATPTPTLRPTATPTPVPVPRQTTTVVRPRTRTRAS